MQQEFKKKKKGSHIFLLICSQKSDAANTS